MRKRKQKNPNKKKNKKKQKKVENRKKGILGKKLKRCVIMNDYE